jgi:hypothetical protein
MMVNYATTAMLKRTGLAVHHLKMCHIIVLFHISSLIKGEINQVKLIFGDALINIDVVMNEKLIKTIVQC